MSGISTLSEQDWQIRLFVYRFFVEHERPPSIHDTAEDLTLPEEDVRSSYQRLSQRHHLYLEPGTDQIRMAPPLSAVPTRYRVQVSGHSLWANCAWDSLGIPAMLGADAQIEARDPVSEDVIHYTFRQGKIDISGHIMHFSVPVRRWYDSLVHT